MTFEELVKEEIDKTKDLDDKDKVKKLTKLVKKIAKDADSIHDRNQSLHRSLKREKEDKNLVERHLTSIADTLESYRTKPEDSKIGY